MPTPHTYKLAKALQDKGIEVILEHSDGHKHVDIFIPKNQMYIEVEGLQHFTDPKQIIADLKRDYYSDKDNHFTFRVTNQLIDTYLDEIVNAIKHVVEVS